MSELSHYIKVISRRAGCNSYDADQFKCDRYLNCDDCLEDKIKEHDKHVRLDAIDDCLNILKIHKNNWGVIEWSIRDIEKLKGELND